MTTSFKKKYTAFLGLLIALTGQVNGIDCEPVCCEAPAYEFSVSGELLYWKPELCGLEGAFGRTTIATTVDGNANTITTITESDEEPHAKWNAGFRVGAEVSYNDFDVEVKWTHFNGHAKFRDDEQFGKWRLKYSIIDLTFGRSFCVSSFYLKPFVGIRAAKIHQKLTAHLETFFTSSLIGDSTVFTDKDDKENFCGVGPQIGIDAEWYLGCNFSLYGSVAFITYYGDVKGRNFNVDTFTSTISVCNGKKKHCFNNLATDGAIGIRFDSTSNNCCGCDIDFMLKLGLEQNRIYDFSDLGSDGNFSLYGGVFAAGVTIKF